MRLRYLSQSGRWPSGNPRLYYRAPGQPAVPMPDLPADHPLFVARWAELHGQPAQPETRGSIGAALVEWLGSGDFGRRSATTRESWRRHAEKMRAKWGSARLSDLAARHITADLAPLAPHAANTRRKVWRAACRWWIEAGRIDADPSAPVRARRTARTQGHPAWTRQDVAAYRLRWPHGTPQRLALELLHYTGARIGDACRLGPPNVRGGWLTYRQSKTGGEVSIPMTPPAYAEPDGQFQRAISGHPHLVWLTTAAGRPRSPKAARQWFAAAARAAGIEKSAHGLRKLRLTILAENGATGPQLQAWCGHASATEVAHYIAAADRRRLLSSNSPDPVSNSTPQEVDRK